MSFFPFDHTYACLPETFYERIDPQPVSNPKIIAYNKSLAEELDLLRCLSDHEDLAALFSGNAIPDNAQPIALAYAGHQFGHFSPKLGDGRAHLLGEIVTKDGRRFDLQLKGSGRTSFSRQGDGRSPLGPAMREYIMSEAMHALGISTTRALALVTTGDDVMRDVPLPGGITARVAASHIRIGTFEYFAAQNDHVALKQLANYTIDRHFPDLRCNVNPYYALFEKVCTQIASLVSHWMSIGFIHGVMNTDNMLISGETIDYGPCAFMDIYHPKTVFSSIDQNGRYAYQNQPQIARWNLLCFGQAIAPLLSQDQSECTRLFQSGLRAFSNSFERTWQHRMCYKMGIRYKSQDDIELFNILLSLMHHQHIDFTGAFYSLNQAYDDDTAFLELFSHPNSEKWLHQWRKRVDQEKNPIQLSTINPGFIPRNHRVEQAIDAAVMQGDYRPFYRLMTILQQPFKHQPKYEDYMHLPQPEERVYQTSCGT